MNAILFCGLILSLLLLAAHGERISEQKCREYRQQIITETLVIPLVLNPNPIIFNSFNCSKTVDLIVGGNNTEPGEFPHQALLGYKNSENSEEYTFICGGSLISKRFVLTAAHCMNVKDFGNPKIVRLGEHDLKNNYGDQIDFDIKNITRHPDYRNFRAYHDIALVELTENVKFSSIIRPACLWTGFDLNVTSVVATGFGLTQTGGDNAKVLQKVRLDFIDKQECFAQFKYERKFREGINDGQLCVGSKEGGRDTCQGDSGGPIQVVTEPEGCIYHIIGVTSTGSGACAVGNSRSIYTRVASYITWIEEQVWLNSS